MLSAKEACLRFKLGDAGFGLPLAEVREIVPAGRIQPVPMAPRYIKGLCGVRGRVVTLLDASALMDRPFPEALNEGDRLALLFAPPLGHLGLYVHAPVEMGHMAERTLAASQSGHHAQGWRQEEPSARLASQIRAEGDGIVHLLSAADLLSRCEAQIRERFRRRA